MKKVIMAVGLILGLSLSANADIWKWVDATGKTHFVDTITPIYTWTDASGEAHYSDTPDHEDAISIDLVWHSSGSIADLEGNPESDDLGGFAYPGETVEDRAEREKAEAYYCERATEIYESYMNAPRLYRTSEGGDREYLSREDAARTIAETRAQKDDLCG